MKEQIIKETIENAKKEIIKAEIWADFYTDFVSKEEDTQVKAANEAKLEGIKKTVEFNQAVVNFLSK